MPAGADKLRSFVGQQMSGQRKVRYTFLGVRDSALGHAGYTPTQACVAFIFGSGPGGSGSYGTAGGTSGGSGGAAGFKKVFLRPGQGLSWIVGTAGASSSVDPSNGSDATDTVVAGAGFVLTAGGGKGGKTNGAVAASGKYSGPWDLARNGGDGGAGGSTISGGTNGASSLPGGGNGGAKSGSGIPAFGGGGASAGFTDKFEGAISGNGGNAGFNTLSDQGAGSGGAAIPTAAGGSGRVIVYLFVATLL